MTQYSEQQRRAALQKRLKAKPGTTDEYIDFVLGVDKGLQDKRNSQLNSQNTNVTNNSISNYNDTAAVDENTLNSADSSVMQDRPRIHPSRFEISENLDNHIRHHEGYNPSAYKDSAGNLTIGIGHKVDDNQYQEGDTISHEKIMKHYGNDKEEARGYALDIVRDLPMYRHEFEAIVDAVYNVGPGNLGLGTDKSPDLNKAIKAGNYTAIGENLMYSKDSDGIRQGGLVRRGNDRKNHYNGIYRKY